MNKFINKLIFDIEWFDDSMPDLVGLNIKVANDRLSANFDCFASLEDIKKTWGRELTTQILSDKKFIWELQGYYARTVKIECYKANSTGLINLKFNISYEVESEVTEQCTLIIEAEPAQLDSFGEKMKQLEAGESVEL